MLRMTCLSLFTTVFVGPFAPLPVENADPCPGCADSTATPTYTSTCGSTDAGITATLSNHAGACWTIGGGCVMEYPCTPWLRVEVWTDYLCGAPILKVGGTIGSVGIGGSRFRGGNWGPSFPDIVYEDYVGVDCGNSTSFSIGAEIYTANCLTPGYTYECTVLANGTFSCAACSD